MSAAHVGRNQNGLDGAGEARRILVNEAAKLERDAFTGARPYERTETRRDYAFPAAHRIRLRTTNGLERINREQHRRTRVASLFSNPNSCLRLVSALLAELDDDLARKDEAQYGAKPEMLPHAHSLFADLEAFYAWVEDLAGGFAQP